MFAGENEKMRNVGKILKIRTQDLKPFQILFILRDGAPQPNHKD